MTTLDQDLEMAIDSDAPPGEGNDFCHILDQSLARFYCGLKRTGPLTCQTYHGEAICPSCSLPTCPTCALQSDLNARLEGLA